MPKESVTVSDEFMNQIAERTLEEFGRSAIKGERPFDTFLCDIGEEFEYQPGMKALVEEGIALYMSNQSNSVKERN